MADGQTAASAAVEQSKASGSSRGRTGRERRGARGKEGDGSEERGAADGSLQWRMQQHVREARMACPSPLPVLFAVTGQPLERKTKRGGQDR
jgi:hypothetical protein